MELSQKDFQVLEALEDQEIETQRQLAAYAGISLGQVNYILKGLLGKGLIKIGRFRKHPSKVKYAYLLTPKGIETKSKLAVKYVIRRLKKYHSLRQRMENRLKQIQQKGCRRILFVGPDMVKEFIVSIINERCLPLELVADCSNWKDLPSIDWGNYDISLIFDSEVSNVNRISAETGIPKSKLMVLW